MKTGFAFILLTPALLAVASACTDSAQRITGSDAVLRPAVVAYQLGAVESLGKLAFEDEDLSVNRNQSCKTCHEPGEGFSAQASTDFATRGGVVEGSVPDAFGDRRPPTAAYAALIPNFSQSGSGGTGGNFWDGRATGNLLGNPAADQALGPFLNPVEQALPDAACVVHRVRQDYANAYVTAWGTDINSIVFPSNTETVCSTPVSAAGNHVALSAMDRARVATAYNNIAKSIAAYEASPEVSKFSSDFDTGQLTSRQREGAKLFGGKGKCHQCHPANGSPVLFSDFKYHNIGAPRNPANPKFNYTTAGASLFDGGLGAITGRSAHMGKFKTPTVRNTALGTHRTYLHNGVLTSVRQVVDFYNTRDLLRVCTPQEVAALDPSQYGSLNPDYSVKENGCWPPPEYPQNLDTKQMGNLGLTPAQVKLIVEFIEGLSDR